MMLQRYRLKIQKAWKMLLTGDKENYDRRVGLSWSQIEQPTPGQSDEVRAAMPVYKNAVDK